MSDIGDIYARGISQMGQGFAAGITARKERKAGALDMLARQGDPVAQEKLKRIAGISAEEESRFLSEQARGFLQAGVLDAEQYDKFQDANVQGRRAIVSQASAALLMKQERDQAEWEYQQRLDLFRQQQEIETQYSQQRSAAAAQENLRMAKTRDQMLLQEQGREERQKRQQISAMAEYLGATHGEKSVAMTLSPEAAVTFLESAVQQRRAAAGGQSSMAQQFEQVTLEDGTVLTVDRTTRKVVNKTTPPKPMTMEERIIAKAMGIPVDEAAAAPQSAPAAAAVPGASPAPAPAPTAVQNPRDLLFQRK